MNTEAAIGVMQDFLSRSPRSALEARIVCNDQPWLWRHGSADGVQTPVFEIGSVGKLFTTTLLALLVQRRQVSVSDPVKRFYPQLPCAERITLQQLASHTSGLPRNTIGYWQLMRRGRQLAEAFQPDDLIAFLQQLPPVFKGAGKARYSNVGMALLGRILGDVCGMPYGAAVDELLLHPLGMHDTHLDPGRYDARHLMQGHDSRGRPVPPFIWRGMEAAGVWRSTGADMMTFLRAHMGLCGQPWASLAERTTRPQARMTRDTQIGLGWMISVQDPWGRVAWHNGGTFGQHSMVAYALNRSAAVVLLTDRLPPWWHHLLPDRQLESLPRRLFGLCRERDTRLPKGVTQ